MGLIMGKKKIISLTDLTGKPRSKEFFDAKWKKMKVSIKDTSKKGKKGKKGGY